MKVAILNLNLKFVLNIFFWHFNVSSIIQCVLIHSFEAFVEKLRVMSRVSKLLTSANMLQKEGTNHKSLSVGVAPRNRVVRLCFTRRRRCTFLTAKVTFSTCRLLSSRYSEHERRRCLGCFALWKMAAVSASDTAGTSWMSDAPRRPSSLWVIFWSDSGAERAATF